VPILPSDEREGQALNVELAAAQTRSVVVGFPKDLSGEAVQWVLEDKIRFLSAEITQEIIKAKRALVEYVLEITSGPNPEHEYIRIKFTITPQ
jgi:hypothetical protein